MAIILVFPISYWETSSPWKLWQSRKLSVVAELLQQKCPQFTQGKLGALGAATQAEALRTRSWVPAPLDNLHSNLEVRKPKAPSGLDSCAQALSTTPWTPQIGDFIALLWATRFVNNMHRSIHGFHVSDGFLNGEGVVIILENLCCQNTETVK